MAAVDKYMSMARSEIWRGAVTQEQVDAAFKTARTWPVDAGDCREIEFIGDKKVREQQERERQLEAFSQSMDRLQETANSMNTRQYQPQTTYCQHYQWGGMTVCNSY